MIKIIQIIPLIILCILMLIISPCYGQIYTDDYKEAKRLGVAHNKYIFVKFTAPWCTWCHKLDNDTLSSEMVKGILETNYIICTIDIDSKPEYRTLYDDYVSLLRRYRWNGLPSYALISQDGKKFIRWGSGYKLPRPFLIWLYTDPRKIGKLRGLRLTPPL